MQDDVTLADAARIREGGRERRDRVVADRQDDDVGLAEPGRRLTAVADGQRQWCWKAFFVSSVEADRIARPGQSQRQSDSRATGPDEPDRAGSLLAHRLRSGEGRCVLASVSRSCGERALSANARARLICASSAIRRRNSTERPKT